MWPFCRSRKIARACSSAGFRLVPPLLLSLRSAICPAPFAMWLVRRQPQPRSSISTSLNATKPVTSPSCEISRRPSGLLHLHAQSVVSTFAPLELHFRKQLLIALRLQKAARDQALVPQRQVVCRHCQFASGKYPSPPLFRRWPQGPSAARIYPVASAAVSFFSSQSHTDFIPRG